MTEELCHAQAHYAAADGRYRDERRMLDDEFGTTDKEIEEYHNKPTNRASA